MKMLVENNGYELFYNPNGINRYRIFKCIPNTHFKQEITRSANFTKKLKSYFTLQQVNTAIAKVHAMKYVGKKFKT